MDIPGCVNAASTSTNGRHAHKHGSLFAGASQERRSSDIGPVGVRSESTMGAHSSSMDGTFGDLQATLARQFNRQPRRKGRTDSFMVKMLDLLTEDEVLEQSRASLANAQAVLVGDRTANVGGHEGASVVDIELRQEFLRLSSSIVAVAVGIAVVSTMKGSFTGQLARQVRASCTGDTSDGRKEAQRPHYDRFSLLNTSRAYKLLHRAEIQVLTALDMMPVYKAPAAKRHHDGGRTPGQVLESKPVWTAEDDRGQ